MWIYDNRIADDEEAEQVTLLELIESVIMANGVRVILLDNLMTAMDLEPGMDSSDKYDRQSIFCKALARIALKYNVLIIMVAHKRKAAGAETNDTVSGSADIVNLASIVISYERPHIPSGMSAEAAEDLKKKRVLKVSKNRLTGDVTDGDGILLSYDPRTKRIYRSNGELKRRYNWDDAWYDPAAMTNQSELPF